VKDEIVDVANACWSDRLAAISHIRTWSPFLKRSNQALILSMEMSKELAPAPLEQQSRIMIN
jgi:hypothetical protein